MTKGLVVNLLSLVNKIIFLWVIVLFGSNLAFSLESQVFKSEFTVSAEIPVSHLSRSRITVCESKEYFNSEDKMCLSIGSDYGEDGSLFLSDPRFHLEELKSQYSIVVKDFNLQIEDIKLGLDNLKFNPIDLNSFLHVGKLKTEGYRQYFIDSGIEVISFNISMSLTAKVVGSESLDLAIQKIDDERKYSRIKYVASSHSVNCFLMINGKVKCVGSNKSGFLGLGRAVFGIELLKDIGDSNFIDFGTDSPVIQIVALDRSFCVLFEMGQVKCWGSNGLGRLGIEAPDFSFYNIGDEPQEIANTDFIKFSEPIIKLFTNAHTLCGLTTLLKLKCWMAGEAGVLGQGKSGAFRYNSQALIEGMPYIDLGDQVRDVFFIGGGLCAVLIKDSIMCWGGNRFGVLGQDSALKSIGGVGSFLSDYNSVNIPKKKMIQWGQVGYYTVCVLYFDGELYCWGDNEWSLLGLENNGVSLGSAEGDMSSLRPIVFESKIIKFVSTGFNICVLLENGTIKCWGKDWSQIDGNASVGDEPGDMQNLQPMRFNTTSRAIELVDYDGRIICADFEDRTRRCWGHNRDYDLAQGLDARVYGFTQEESLSLSPIFPYDKSEKYFVGSRVNCILTRAGQLKCVGENSVGQLGLPNSIYRFGKNQSELDQSVYLPLGDIKVKNLLLLDLQLCAIYVTDQMKCWGLNRYGTLGQGSELYAIGRSGYEIESLDYLKY